MKKTILSAALLIAAGLAFQQPAHAAAPALPETAAKPAPFEVPTMYAMNSKTAMERIRKGFFDQVYRGFGTRKADRIGRDELLGFHFLIDTDCQSHGLRSLIKKHEMAGRPPAEALDLARREHLQVLRQTFAKLESLKNLFENYKGKAEMLEKTGMPDPESHFIFTSPNLSVAKFYGPIVLVIEEARPRGMDLNSIARDSKYYTVARFLKNLAEFQFRSILSDYVADRDEYVLPSYLSPNDVKGLIVYDPSPIVIANRLVIPPPPVRRVYRKQFEKGAMAIDVYDAKDRLIARLCASPSAATIDESIERSPEKLPDEIQAAWNAYAEKLRRRR
ncbi:MAG TPA: hypothetical protein VIV61_01755 [Candidatus Ozemobacteraceae bacterium]